MRNGCKPVIAALTGTAELPGEKFCTGVAVPYARLGPYSNHIVPLNASGVIDPFSVALDASTLVAGAASGTGGRLRRKTPMLLPPCRCPSAPSTSPPLAGRMPSLRPVNE